MNKEESFNRIMYILAPYKLSIQELKIILWHYLNGLSVRDMVPLMEGVDGKGIAKSRIHKILQKAIQHMQQHQKEIK